MGAELEMLALWSDSSWPLLLFPLSVALTALVMALARRSNEDKPQGFEVLPPHPPRKE
jgi:hypothetical protein